MYPPAAFDAVAATYDAEFTQTPIARLMRRAVWARLDANFRAGMRVLELGCGTGEDAVYLAQRGVRVTATDASANMLTITRQKAKRAGVGELVETRVLDLNDGRQETEDRGQLASSVLRPSSYNGVLSNFGALNCVANIEYLISNLCQWTKPHARIILIVMGPFCPWEIVWHLAHLQLCQAFRRWSRNGAIAHVGGALVRVWYPSPRRLRKMFAPHFKHLHTTGLGVLLPPPYTQTTDGRRRTAMRCLVPGYWLLATLEHRIAHRFPFNQCGDHYMLELERQ